MKYPGPILVADRFPALRTHLIELLADLSESDWDLPTAAPAWSVKDVAAHLLGGDISILARKRDQFHMGGIVIHELGQLIELVNRLNAEWVLAARRMSPRLLREFLAFTGPEVEKHFASLDPMAVGDPVSWAGPEPAPVWLDIAREFTERWHHQQQIRDATGRAALYDPWFLSPVLDTFVRALPYSFRRLARPDGTLVRFEISGESGGVWLILRANLEWKLVADSPAEPAVDVVLPQDTAWRMFTKGIDREGARLRAGIRGDSELASPIFATVSVLA